MENEYSHYGVEEFMMDDAFIQWVLNPDSERDTFWKNFIDNHPEKAKDIDTASTIVRQLVFEKHSPQAADRQQVWQRLQLSIRKQQKRKVIRLPRYWRAAAAIFIGLLLIGGYWTWNASQTVTIRTAYGEVRTLELPDHSRITLNAHSSIKYKKGWNKDKHREVWLQGEAYFQVNHLHQDNTPVVPGDHFIVHTDNLNVEVLGTVFNVNDRHKTTTVVLESGKVRLDFRQENQREIIMQPGEVVKYADDHSIVRARTNVNRYTSWTEKKLEFDNTPLREIIRIIHDNYGYEVKLQDTSLASKTMSGTISAANETVLFKGIATVLGLHITKLNDRTIVISDK